MSAYSEWKCGALTDEQYEFEARREHERDNDEPYIETCDDCILNATPACSKLECDNEVCEDFISYEEAD